MTPHEIALVVSGFGMGAVAAMFGTGYLLVRQFEEREEARGMFSGYVITEDADQALELIGLGGVRYAARLDDGRGFAAFDSTDEVGSGGAVVNGTILRAFEPIPDYPPSWPKPERPQGPKRQVARGDERFVLYRMLPDVALTEMREMFTDVFAARAAAVVFDGEAFFVLVETGPEWRCPFEPVWDAVAVKYRDVRLEVSA